MIKVYVTVYGTINEHSPFSMEGHSGGPCRALKYVLGLGAPQAPCTIGPRIIERGFKPSLYLAAKAPWIPELEMSANPTLRINCARHTNNFLCKKHAKHAAELLVFTTPSVFCVRRNEQRGRVGRMMRRLVEQVGHPQTPVTD